MSIVNSNNFLHKTVDGVKQFFSPLVNAATVVRKDGTRLEQDGKVYADSTLDSAKLGGVEASKYAKLTDIPESAGGSGFAYNHLDNSNFLKFIAQAGVSGKHGTVTYAGDRWILSSGTITATDNSNGDGYSAVTLNGTIYQKVADAPTTATAAIGMVSGTATIDYANGVVTITSDGGVIKWSALYEGEYTADNLPPYVPKGYAAELAECQRYYYTYGNLRLLLLHNADGVDRGTFLFPTKMRIIPTLSYEITGDVDAQFTLEETTKQGFSCYANDVKGCVQIVNCIANADL